MLSFAKAREIAITWVSATTGHEGELLRDPTIAKPYGWIFFYQSKEFVRDPSRTSAAFAGNGPFLIDRVNGNVHTFGTALPLNVQLAEYERTLPEAQLHMAPEQPKWEAA